MSPALLSWAFAAGSVAAFNPCGFAVLPAYLAYHVGRDAAGSAASDTIRGTVRGLLMTAGVLSLFAVVGGAMGMIRAVLLPVLPWLATLVGAVLVSLGVVMLIRRSVAVELSVVNPIARAGAPSRTWVSAYLFGVGYGVASLGCTLPIFLTISAQSLATRSLGEALVVFLAYGLGMGWIVMVVTVAVAVGNTAVVRFLRPVMGWVRTAGAVGMIAAGGYLVYFYRGLLGGVL